MICVDYVGEYGVVVIYCGQCVIFDKLLYKVCIVNQFEEMEVDEQVYFDVFDDLIFQYKVCFIVLVLIWNVVGQVLGVVMVLMGEWVVYVCIEVVESVIEQYYVSQVIELCVMGEDELVDLFMKFCEEEIVYYDFVVEEGVCDVAGYLLLFVFIKIGC